MTPGASESGPAEGKDLHLDVRAEILRRLAGRGTHARYRIEGEIARGAQGAILQAFDGDLHRKLAMKVILRSPATDKPEKDDDSHTLGRFLEEAQITGQLDHPGIVPVHELGLDAEGRLYFTMRLVRGRDLKQIYELVRSGQEGWNVTRALGVLLKVCEAMAYAHKKGVIHRDLKPGNIMVGRFGEVYVMDWGLARVLGHPDGRDLRVRPEPETISVVESDMRHGSSGELLTMDGTAIGTPAYMAPEQARGESAELDARADVYALGAMLYHLLTGQVPFVPPGARMTAREVLWRAVEGPPQPVHVLAPSVPMELVAITEKAMARDPQRRYHDMEELRHDLAAFLEHRVVAAYATGALAELSKWIARNRALAVASAAVVLAVIGGLATALVLRSQSERNAVLAAERGVVAERRGDELRRLSAFQRLEDLEREADRLWPPSPALVPACRSWLERAARLVAELEPGTSSGYPGHRAKLAELTARGRASSPEELEQELRRHPRFGELERERARLAQFRSVLAARTGAPAPPPELETGLPEDAPALLDLAWPEVDPDRTAFGGEAHGLALARRALERAGDEAQFARASEVVAWGLFALGRDEEARAELEAALEIVPPTNAASLQAAHARLAEERVRVVAPQSSSVLEEGVSALEAELAGPQALRFDDEDDRWWHHQLEKLVRAIEDFADPHTGLIEGLSPAHGLGVARRVELAAALDERSRSGAPAAELWRAACASIADARACPQYGGLALAPQLGLLPLGRDPRSGLWEFAHLLSGEAPQRDERGGLVLTPESGLVLVLLPGGSAWMGAQASLPGAPNFDPGTIHGESPVHRVLLSPFFLSKYEMTQGQWLRFTGENPSRDSPEVYEPGWNANRARGDLRHPVESVSWFKCRETLARLGLELPSEAQWEYGARAGTTGVRWTGDALESLAGAANICDRYAHEHGGASWGTWDDWLDDGYTSHAPVGSFRPNAFGLFDVLGNVWEWCEDGYQVGFYSRSPPADPLCAPSTSAKRVARGGGICNHSDLARSACRYDASPGLQDGELGVRPARGIDP